MIEIKLKSGLHIAIKQYTGPFLSSTFKCFTIVHMAETPVFLFLKRALDIELVLKF
jgi:hypothetical protein